jgi:iron complex transport system permease protein
MKNKLASNIMISGWLIGGVVLIFSISIAVSVGSISIPLTHVWGIISHHLHLADIEPTWSRGQAAIVWQVRLPRALLAAMVGAGLALVGAALQAVTRNPLSDPHLLGISSGAAFGAVLALLHTGLFLGALTVPLFAFIGALLAASIVLLILSNTTDVSANRLILTGVAVSFILMGLANGLIFLGDPKASHTAVFWMLGGLGLATWDMLAWPLIILVGASIWFLSISNTLNAIMVGDETALTLGISPRKNRIYVFIVSSLITGIMVAFSGIIGFVGLIIPHISRLIIGGNNVKVIPASMLIGAIFLVWADILARTLIQPEDLPIGIITGLVGGGFFLWLLNRSQKH